MTAGTPVSALSLATMRGGAGVATANAAAAAIASVQQAQTATQQSMSNLLRATQAVQSMQQTQAAARALAQRAPGNVPNGLVTGGLQVAPGASGDISNPALWLNANAPTQSVAAGGQVTVDVKQTAQSAVATWETMNVGSNTTLNFDQSGGTQTNGANNWVILNRIMDPSGAPSQILGNVTAQGTVLVINRNGIIFGAGSQINVHSLVASSLDLLNANDDLVQTSTDIAASNQAFLNGGLAGLEAGTSSTTPVNNGNPTEILGLGNNVSVTSSSQLQIPGDITIAPGASITTSADGSVSNGGFVLIAAPNVTNGGSITAAPTGQVILAAGIGVSLIPNSSDPQVLQAELTGRISIPVGNGSTDITPAGTLTNTGVVQTERGDINLLGSSVTQNGVVGVDNGCQHAGQYHHLDRR